MNENQKDDITKIIEYAINNIEDTNIRKTVCKRISEIALRANFEDVSKLIKELLRFEDGKATLRNKWKIIINNVMTAEEVFGELIVDEQIRIDAVKNVDYLLKYGSFASIPELAEKLSKLDGGPEKVADKFEEFLEVSYDSLDKLFIACTKSNKGIQKAKRYFSTIRNVYDVESFFNFIREVKDIPEFSEEYQTFGFWAELYNQIQIPKTVEATSYELGNLSPSKVEEYFENQNAELRKKYIFKKIINNDQAREEQRAILETVSEGRPFKFKGIGAFSIVAQTGDQIIKLGRNKRKYEIPYHPRIMMPCFRKKYSDENNIEIFNIGDTTSDKITSENVLEIFKELEEAGIIWGDARKENLAVLLKDNNIPSYILSKDFNVFGFIKDARFPTTEHIPLKEGELVICDLDFLYAKDDPAMEFGPLDELVSRYVEEKGYRKQDEDKVNKESDTQQFEERER